MLTARRQAIGGAGTCTPLDCGLVGCSFSDPPPPRSRSSASPSTTSPRYLRAGARKQRRRRDRARGGACRVPGADRLERAANIDFFRGKLLPSRGTTPAAERILSAGLPQVETAPDTACVTSRATLNLSTGGVGYGCLWRASRALFYAFCAAPWWRPGPPGGAGRSGVVICFEHKAAHIIPVMPHLDSCIGLYAD